MISGLLCLSVLVMSIVQAHATVLPVMHDAVNTSAAIHHDGMADAMAPPSAHHHTGSPCKGHDGACGLDAAFANPETYEFLEAEGYKYTIRLPAEAGRWSPPHWRTVGEDRRQDRASWPVDQLPDDRGHGALRSVPDHPGRHCGAPPVAAGPMLTNMPASVARLPAGDACLDADRRAGVFLGATLLKRSAVAGNSIGRFTIAARNALAVGCPPAGAAGPPIREMSD